jgi:hypothetical protein
VIGRREPCSAGNRSSASRRHPEHIRVLLRKGRRSVEAPTNANDRFLRLMAVILAAAGVVWLALSLYNVRNGSSFNWTGLFIFFLAPIIWVVSRRGRPSR